MSDDSPTPLDVLKETSAVGAQAFLDHKNLIIDDPRLQALPKKVKLLIGIGVAASLQLS